MLHQLNHLEIHEFYFKIVFLGWNRAIFVDTLCWSSRVAISTTESAQRRHETR